MEKPFTNVHMHVFNTDCAPERFFRVLSSGFVNPLAGRIKGLIESRAGRALLKSLHRMMGSRDEQRRMARLLSFVQIGSKNSQLEIFQLALEAANQFDSSARLVGLTMNMDYMDSHQHLRKSFETQLEEVRDIKRYYPDRFFPFLGVDPRHRSGRELRDWVQRNFEAGFKHRGRAYPYFYGIKLYPAQGFFPFDPRLEETLAFAEEHDIPIMTHCTRGGSIYVGDNIQSLVPRQPLMIDRAGNQAIEAARVRAYERIACYYEAGHVKNNRYGLNGAACDLFSHPDNYTPLLEAFPRLKICLAHMGGTTEFVDAEKDKLTTKEAKSLISKEGQALRKLEGGTLWVDIIARMMRQYPQLYTDVSYSVSDFDKEVVIEKLTAFLGDPADEDALGRRVLFGTDFFMTEQEKQEVDLYRLMLGNERLKPWLAFMTRENPANYLSNIRDVV
jgi:predicted TIM-barrel fold metal-dependent hydrolase